MAEQLLNIEEITSLSGEELQAKIDEANTKFTDLQSNSDRWVQKVLDEKRLSEKALKAIAEINWDNAKLVDLYETDPKLGNYLLQNVFNGASIDDFRDGGSWAKTITEDFDTKYQAKRIEETIEEVSSKLPKDVQEKFDAEFKDLTEGKKLTKENVDKYIKMALREANPDYSKEEMEARVHSMGGWVAKPQEAWPKRDQATSSFLEQMGVVRKAVK